MINVIHTEQLLSYLRRFSYSNNTGKSNPSRLFEIKEKIIESHFEKYA